jgi:hypothetical protein
MPSYGKLCYVVLVRANISEERIASIITVTRIGELGIEACCEKILCEKGSARMGYKSKGRGKQVIGMGFVGNVK